MRRSTIKKHIPMLLCALLFSFGLVGCENSVALENRTMDMFEFRYMSGASVTNSRGENLFVGGDSRLAGNMLTELVSGMTGIDPPTSVVPKTLSEYYSFYLPSRNPPEINTAGVWYFYQDTQSADLEEWDNVYREASFSSGTATLYQDGSVVLDGDLTEFEVRIQLPEDREHQWIIKGNGAEQDHVEIYFKDGEPVVESINDELTYTVEKEEIPQY